MNDQSERLHAWTFVQGMLASMSTRGEQKVHGHAIQEALTDILPAVKSELVRNRREVRFNASEDRLHDVDEQIFVLFRAGELQRNKDQAEFLDFCFKPGNVEKYICALHFEPEFLRSITNELIESYERHLNDESS